MYKSTNHMLALVLCVTLNNEITFIMGNTGKVVFVSKVTLINPLSPDIKMHIISPYCSRYTAYGTSEENLSKCQGIFSYPW